MRLVAIILAVILISPGVLWGQGARLGSRVQSGPRQADKSFTLERQKKRPRIRNPKQKTRSNRKQKVRSSRKKQSQPTKKSIKSYRRTN